MLERLSDSERRVVDLVMRGLTNREVADELGLSHKTVEWTLTNVYSKFAVRSRTELTAHLACSGVNAAERPTGQTDSSDVGLSGD
jgi:DNA-binding CsgD family transcriptional regulator